MKRDMKTVPELVTEQARRTPAAPAVVIAEQMLTFAELDARSNQIAHWLRGRGVGTERIVGVCMSRTADLMPAVLGVLKAGGVYLPLEPTLPLARRAYMVKDAGAAFVMNDELLIAHGDAISAYPSTSMKVTIAPGQLAYVIYTSGSSGQPKGVMVQHDQLSAYLDWAVASYLPTGRGTLLYSPVTFDLTITSMFAPLIAGRTVHILPLEDPPVSFVPAALADGDFSFVKITPAHLVLLSEALPAEAMAIASDQLIVGGEPLSYGQLSAWAQHAPQTLVVNEYGPTEAVVGCCVHTIRATDARSQRGPVPIGRATPGTRLMVLNELLEPVAPGTAGELFIGGAQVSRGYLNRPGLTAQRFLPDPIAAGGRMYRTGDRVHEGPDGILVYLGRLDEQINLRGYRIEPGEIEGALSQHPDVAAAGVAIRGEGGRERLVGYLVPRPGADMDMNKVREYAACNLPRYMVPMEYVTLDMLPLTPNGKVDRPALPQPESPIPGATAGRPAGALEAEIAGMFSQVLNYPVTDFTADFIAIGGTSLHVAQVIVRLSRTYGVNLPAETWQRVPTIAGFALLVDTYIHAGREAALNSGDETNLDIDLDDEILDALDKEASHVR